MNRWTNRGGSNWPKFEDPDWPVGGEDKPKGWVFTTSVQDSHPTLKPPVDSMVDLTSLFVIDDMVCDVLLLSPTVPHGPPLSTNIRLSSLPSHPIIPGVAS